MNSNSQIQTKAVKLKMRFTPAAREIVRQAVIFSACAAIGRAALPDGTSPFGSAACAAAFVAGMPASALLGCIAGAATRLNWSSLISMAAFCAAAWAFKEIFRQIYPRQVLLALLIGETLAWLIIPHATTYESLIAALGGVASLLLSQLYLGAIRLTQSFRIRKLLNEEEIISLCILIGTILLGFSGIEVRGVYLGSCFAVCITVLVASAGGAGPGAATGLALGAMMSVGGYSDYLALLGLIGVTAGGLHHIGKLASGAGGLLAATVVVFFGRTDTIVLLNCVVGSAFFFALPPVIPNEIGRFVNASLRRESNRKEYLDRLREMTQHQISEFKEAFEEMGEVFSQPISYRIKTEWDVEAMKSICKGCVAMRRCWSDVDKLRSELIQIFNGEEIPFRLQRCRKLDILCLVGQAMDQAAEREDRLREKADTAAATAGRQLMGVADVMGRISTRLRRDVVYDDLMEAKLLRFLDKAGIPAKDSVVQWAGGRLSVRVEGKSCSGQCEKKMQNIVSKTCGCSMRISGRECGDVCRVFFEQARNFEVQIGIAQCAKDGGDVIGDTVLSAGLAESRHLLAISDGMGSGARAKEESMATIALLHKLYAAGIDRQTIIEAVNRLLLIRSNDEMYSTVDSCCVDLINGQAELCKLGAPVSFWINQDGVHTLKGESLPVGILDNAEADVFTMKIREGDWIILVSDGVADALGEAAPPKIAAIANGDPQIVAERLLSMASQMMLENCDDMSAVVARIDGGVSIAQKIT